MRLLEDPIDELNVGLKEEFGNVLLDSDKDFLSGSLKISILNELIKYNETIL
tara:strand:+ start:170 stop:325 length:156 start_codon:yes stop_codon:yes gene_type:complete